MYHLGSIHNTNAAFYTTNNIAWTNDSITVLGIKVGYGNEINGDYSDLILKSETVLKSWIHRGLSLLGKINIINTLVASLFVYRMYVMPSMNKKSLKRIENIFTNFLWSGRKAKIPMRVLQRTVSCGGANLVNLRAKDHAIKIAWTKILRDDPKAANLVYFFTNNVLKEDVWLCNVFIR